MVAFANTDPIPRTKMTKLQHKRVPLRCPCLGVNTFVPVTFGEWYFPVLSCSIHSVLTSISLITERSASSCTRTQPQNTKYNNTKSLSFEQYVKKQLRGMSVISLPDAAIFLYRLFISYLISGFYEVRAFFSCYTPKGVTDTETISEPRCVLKACQYRTNHSMLSSHSFRGLLLPHTSTPSESCRTPVSNHSRCRIVSGTEGIQEVTSRQKHPTLSAFSDALSSPATPTHDCVCPSPFGTSPARFPATPLLDYPMAHVDPPPEISLSPTHRVTAKSEKEDGFSSLTEVVRQEENPVSPTTVRPISDQPNNNNATIRCKYISPAYERAHDCMRNGESEKDPSLFPFGSETCFTLVEYLVQDFAEGISKYSSTPEELPRILSDQLSDMIPDLHNIWEKLIASTFRSPVIMFNALSQRFYKMERLLSLGSLYPHPTKRRNNSRNNSNHLSTQSSPNASTLSRSSSEPGNQIQPTSPTGHLSPLAPPTIPTSCSSVFTYPCSCSISLDESCSPLRRNGLEFHSVSTASSTSALANDKNPLLHLLNSTLPPTSSSPPSGHANHAKATIPRGIHLVVFVHGFHGNRHDFRDLKNYMALFLPEDSTNFLLAESLEKIPYQGIGEMAEKLATEIVEYIAFEKMTIHKLSFITHSMGAIVVRCALSRPSLSKDRKSVV